MDDRDYKIAGLEESCRNFRRELDEVKAMMHKTQNDVHEAQVSFVEFSTKIDTIHKLLSEKKKEGFSWFQVVISLAMVGFAIEKVVSIGGK